MRKKLLPKASPGKEAWLDHKRNVCPLLLLYEWQKSTTNLIDFLPLLSDQTLQAHIR